MEGRCVNERWIEAGLGIKRTKQTDNMDKRETRRWRDILKDKDNKRKQ